MPKKQWDEKGEKIQTYIPESHKVELKVRLHYHGMTQAGFLRGIIKAFLEEDAQFMVWFDEWKLRNSKVKSSKRHAKSDKLKQKGNFFFKKADVVSLNVFYNRVNNIN